MEPQLAHDDDQPAIHNERSIDRLLALLAILPSRSIQLDDGARFPSTECSYIRFTDYVVGSIPSSSSSSGWDYDWMTGWGIWCGNRNYIIIIDHRSSFELQLFSQESRCPLPMSPLARQAARSLLWPRQHQQQRHPWTEEEEEFLLHTGFIT